MKRILLSVFAAAIAAAWAVPATAGDVSLSGQYRLRGEYRSNPTFTDGEAHQSFLDQRVRLTANAKASDDTSVKITVQDSRRWGGANQLTDDAAADSTVDLHEASLNIDKLLSSPVSLKLGRQELSYGDERLVGAFNWSNNGRSFDAIKAVYAQDAFNLDLIVSKITEATTATTAGGAGGGDNDTDFLGGYATVKTIPNNTLDLYALNTRNNATGMKLYTIGARLKGAVAGVDYTLELPYQLGEVSSTSDVSAWAFAGKASYTIPNTPKLKVGAEVDYSTGDDTTSADYEAWTDLYPTNHGHFGYIDVSGTTWSGLAGSGLTAFSVNASAEPNDKLKVYGAYWNYTATETASGADDAIGSAVDLTANYKLTSAVNAEIGLSHFFVGDATSANGEDQNWGYLMLTANF
ncbi:MAG: alginate export family protein [Deltaproteobacteria bacterium]